MIKYENECIGCPLEIGCMGSSCPNLNVPRAYCDSCGDEAEEFYYYDGEWLCKECYIEAILEGAETATTEDLIERG